MKLVPSLDMIKAARAGGYAIPSFCVWNAETMDLVLKTAARLKAPLMLMAGPGEFHYFSPRQLVALARALGADYDCEVAIHLDHGDSVELVEECIAAGFSSVMLDWSTKSFEENVAGLKRCVELARPRGVTVEGEIGRVGKANVDAHEGAGSSRLTDPAEAEEYCRRTGIDLVAVSIGNAHGSYLRLPRFDFALLETLGSRLEVPLVLHGGSGTPPEDLKRAISLGMAKINVATEFIEAIKKVCLDEWVRPVWLPATTKPAMESAEKVLEKWIGLSLCAGKAR